MSDTHVTAPTQYVEAGGIRYAYRRFGAGSGVPLVFFQHFRGGMDHWDPAITDGLGAGRPIILFDNAGVAGSSGETPPSFDDMAKRAGDFLDALQIAEADLLGFSMGGFVAQSVALQFPGRVRKLVLVGTGPRGGVPSQDPNVPVHARSTDEKTGDSPLEAFLYLFFSPSDVGRKAGEAFWERRQRRTEDRDVPASMQTMGAQLAAMQAWLGARDEDFAELGRITQPTLVVNGSNDVMIPTINSYTLSQHIPNAQLILYPDSGHGAHFQYPELFVMHATLFLDA